MAERASPEVLAMLRETIHNQMEAEDPPEVRATFDRLREAGYDEDVTYRLLSAAILQEMSLIMKYERSFDREGYIAALHSLPELHERDA